MADFCPHGNLQWLLTRTQPRSKTCMGRTITGTSLRWSLRAHLRKQLREVFYPTPAWDGHMRASQCTSRDHCLLNEIRLTSLTLNHLPVGLSSFCGSYSNQKVGNSVACIVFAWPLFGSTGDYCKVYCVWSFFWNVDCDLMTIAG